MAYDSERGKVLLYGGYGSNNNRLLSDTWEWDGKDWTEVANNDSPIASGHAMVEHTAINKIIVMYSGGNGTWAWNGKGWYDLDIADPPNRSDGRFAYDNKHNRTIFFGGSREGNILSDTWVFDGENWTALNLPVYPSGRRGHMLFFDKERERIVLFGGGNYEKRFNDTWELNLPDDLTDLLVTPTLENKD